MQFLCAYQSIDLKNAQFFLASHKHPVREDLQEITSTGEYIDVLL
jgi:hypothetical protein